jgi:tRNA threonylcarbamoyladenosine biosynthesis protein TsaE
MLHLHPINTLDDLERLAHIIVQQAEHYPLILLKGDLGAGKTTLAQMICRILGVNEPVTSPTYTLVNEYEAGVHKIYHFDLYRLQKPEELDGFGFLEYIDSGHLCLIEWPEIAEPYFTGMPAIEIIIRKLDQTREIELKYYTLTT